MMTKFPLLSIALGLILLTFFEFRAVSWMQEVHHKAQVDAALGVLSGHPHWKAYQSRLLGPVTVACLAHLAHISFSRCYPVACFLILGLANAFCFAQFRKAAGRVETAWAYTAAYAALFVAFQDRDWLYLWDYMDMVTMLLFASAIFTQAPLWKFVVIFFIELLSREAAMFIALWIVLDAARIIPGPSARRSSLTIDKRQAFIGVVLIAAGVAWTHFIRERLFVHQTLVFAPGYHTVGDEFWMLPHTFELLQKVKWDALVPLAACCAPFFLLRRAWVELGEQAWKIGLLLCALIASVLMFAKVTETRVWFAVLPFLLWLAYKGNTRTTNRTAPSRDANVVSVSLPGR